jgi:hypothetical protein
VGGDLTHVGVELFDDAAVTFVGVSHGLLLAGDVLQG